MVRVLLPLSLLSAATAFQVVDTHDHLDYNGMKSAMLSMAKHISTNGIDDSTKGAINGFLQTITDTLLPALDADKLAAQGAFDAAKAVVQKCNDDRTTWINGADSGLVFHHGTVNKALDDHDDCRHQEQVTFDNYTHHCSTLQSRVCSWRNCDQPSFTAGDTDAVNDYICCVTDFFDAHRVAYYAELAACNVATSLHHKQTALCDKEQGVFQDEFCSRENHIHLKCKWYDQCRCSSETEYESVRQDVQDLEKIFQTQFVALQHLVCYATEMLREITDLSGCDGIDDDCEADYPTTCPQIVYAPDPDPFIQCNELAANYPCQATFKTQFYGWLATDQECTPIDDCDDTYCDNADITAFTYFGDRKQKYADCSDE